MVDTVQRRLALQLQVESAQAGGADARMPRPVFEALVRAHLGEMDFLATDADDMARQIMEIVTDRLVFATGLVKGFVGFEIRPLQEFLAAEALMEGKADQVCARLRTIAPIPSWRSVFLFAADRCFADPKRPHQRDTILAICGELNDDPEEPLSCDTLQGSALALDLLEEGIARSRPTQERMLARLALRLLDLPPLAVHVRLADCGHHTLMEVYTQELDNRLRRARPEDRLGAWGTLATIADAGGVAWAEALAERSWPVKAEDAALLLEELAVRDGWISAVHLFSARLIALQEPAVRDGWMVRRSVPSLPPCSPAQVIQILEWPHGAAFRGVDSPWISALQDSLGREYGDSVKRRIDIAWRRSRTTRGWRGETLGFRLIPLDGARHLAPLLTMPPERHALWEPLMAAVEFACRPCRDTLVSALRTFLHQWDPLTIGAARRLMPWPLAACLAAAGCDDELDAVLARVRRGDMGDHREWAAAEKRWLKNGITNQDFYSTAAAWPFDPRIATRGFPFAASSRFWDPEHINRQLLTDLLVIDEAVAGTRLSSFAAGLVVEVMQYVTPDQDGPLALDRIRNLISRSTSSQLDLDILQHVPLDTAEGLALVDWMGQRCAFAFSFADYSYDVPVRQVAIVRNILAALEGNPRMPGLLRILADLAVPNSDYWTDWPAIEVSPTVVAQSDELSPESERAALDLILSQRSLAPFGDIADVAKRVAALERVLPHSIGRLLRTAIDGRAYYEEIADLAGKVRRTVGDMHPSDLRQVHLAQTLAIDTRPDPLARPDERNRLGLPYFARVPTPDVPV